MGASLLFQNRSTMQIDDDFSSDVVLWYWKGTKANHRDGTRKVFLKRAPLPLVLEGYNESPMVKSAHKCAS